MYIIIYSENYAGHSSTGGIWIELSWQPWQYFSQTLQADANIVP
jgi:hypothetical protein